MFQNQGSQFCTISIGTTRILCSVPKSVQKYFYFVPVHIGLFWIEKKKKGFKSNNHSLLS